MGLKRFCEDGFKLRQFEDIEGETSISPSRPQRVRAWWRLLREGRTEAAACPMVL